MSSVTGVQGYWIDAEPLRQDADILKMDCEGCEYDVLSSVDPDSLKFEQVMLEFHHGCRPLIKILEQAGYSVNVIHSVHTRNLGFIYAKLKSNSFTHDKL